MLSLQHNNTALYLSSQHGHKEIVKLLLSSGANVDKPNMVITMYLPMYNTYPVVCCHLFSLAINDK